METARQQSPSARPLGFTPEQLAARRNTLGGSEIAAVAGLNKYSSPIAVWAEKRGLIPPFEGNEFTEWGQRLEPVILQKYIEVTQPRGIHSPGTIIDDSNPWRSVTPDLLVYSDVDVLSHGVEAKRFGEHRLEDFGPSGTDQVPIDVAAQCYWGMDILKLRRWDVTVLLGQADWRTFSLAYDEETAASLREIGHDFWHRYVLPGIEPPLDGSSSAHETLAKRYPTHSDLLLAPTEATLEFWRQLVGVKKQIQDLGFAESELAAQLKAHIGAAAGIEGVATWKAPRTGAISWKAVAESLATTAGIDTAAFNAIVAAHTGEASRRFLVKGV